jgi:rare lipoprotein A
MSTTTPSLIDARAIVALLAAGSVCVALAQTPASKDPPPRPNHPAAKGHKLDHSGRSQVGKASFYANKFAGRKMADGTPMDPKDNNAASKTLPLGTKALVTNLETGQSAVVTIQDRGPYVDGRIVDLSPATAEKIGLSREAGLAAVEVAPIVVPQPDGSMKPGAAATGVATNTY